MDIPVNKTSITNKQNTNLESNSQNMRNNGKGDLKIGITSNIFTKKNDTSNPIITNEVNKASGR
jgi:hypothetical protein